MQSSYAPSTVPEIKPRAPGHSIERERFPLHGELREQYAFKSPGELEDYVRSTCKNGAEFNFGPFNSRNHVDRLDWAWGWSGDQILELSRMGWTQGAEFIGAPSIGLANAVIGGYDANSFVMDVSGAGVDVATYLQGVPECMYDFRESDDKGLKLNIVLDGFVSHTADAVSIFQRGIVLTSAVLALETLGIAVTLTMRDRGLNTGGPLLGKIHENSVILHQPGWALDPARLAVWLGHPGWLRTVYYEAGALMAGFDNWQQMDYAEGGLKKTNEAGTVNIGQIYGRGTSHEWNSPERCREIVEELLTIAKKPAA